VPLSELYPTATPSPTFQVPQSKVPEVNKSVSNNITLPPTQIYACLEPESAESSALERNSPAPPASDPSVPQSSTLTLPSKEASLALPSVSPTSSQALSFPDVPPS
jgi:hypothetical protein